MSSFKNCILICIIFSITANIKASYNKYNNYFNDHLPDKVYIQTDKNLYSQGDTIWTKAYVFNRSSNLLSNNSYSLHIQLLSSKGKQVGTYKMLIVNGMGYGQIPINRKIEAGFYQIIAHTGYMKNFSQQFFFKKAIEISENKNEMLIRPIFNKNKYMVGDTATILFKAFDNFRLPIPKQSFNYKLVHNSKIIEQGNLQCNSEGEVKLLLPISCGSRNNPPKLILKYHERNTNNNNIIKENVIPIHPKKINLHFYPEGGNLINGLQSKVAFKVVDSNGYPIDIKGALYINGEKAFDINSIHDGMGFFNILPDNNKYSFKITQPADIDSIFHLPKAIDKGISLSYIKQNKNNVYLNIKHNSGNIQKVGLWISHCDSLIYANDINVNKTKLVAIPKQNLPEGIITFTVSDVNNIPQAERLVYINKQNQDITINTPTNIYSQRKKVTVNIQLKDTTKIANLSVAVIDSILGNSPWINNASIKSYGLLTSELKGKIINPDYYLSNNRKIKLQRDLLLMTHGWRKFSWIENNKHLKNNKIIDFNVITGIVKRFKFPHANAQLSAMSIGDAVAFGNFTTDKNGIFKINPKFDTNKSQDIVIMAKSKHGLTAVGIYLNNNDTLLFNDIINNNKNNLIDLCQKQHYKINITKKDKIEEPFLLYETKILEEVQIIGKKQINKDSELSKRFKAYDAHKFGTELYSSTNFAGFVAQVSSKIDYNRSDNRIIVRSLGVSTITSKHRGMEDTMTEKNEIDPPGAIVYLNGSAWGKEINTLDFLTKDNISEIVVLDGDKAKSIYGNDAEYGAILVNTHEKYYRNKLNRNMAVFGKFIKEREFNSFDIKNSENIVIDNRITLDWKPFVKTKNGKASFSFYTDDISGTKQIVIQGIDNDGNLLFKNKSITTKTVGFK